MAQLGDGLNDLDVGEADELQKVLENMMTELMSKEILYEPLKELHDKVRLYANVQQWVLSLPHTVPSVSQGARFHALRR